MTQSYGKEIVQEILKIRVQWNLNWAERNIEFVRGPDEALMRRKQEDDWNESDEKRIIETISILPRHTEQQKADLLAWLEKIYSIAPQLLSVMFNETEDPVNMD
jgi:hypothetical protein